MKQFDQKDKSRIKMQEMEGAMADQGRRVSF